MSNPHPVNAGKGRGKGNKNKTTAAIKDMIDQALREAGGVEYLKLQAIDNPSAFMGLIGKILPKDITLGGSGGGPVLVEMVKRIVDPKRDT
jgi:hypothetical protein